ncbi:39 kDa FK506-binding nuclear protein [Drosophila subpulchrella]|uniref:39 kDa FK506-binding nuclear protein n=1 Tax=Drosophila subpulchrella TaxID=1486046 RepID=UPI0018A17F56|nr:39 kDa FK506-binding nuclear protein [Drosophila subpulchrella]
MSMFWGLNMKPERKYSQTIIKSFHVSGVALDKGQEAKLYLAAEKQEYIVATVTKDIPQVALDLNFSKGDRIMFYTAGDATVSLLGYLHDIDSDDDDEDFTLEKLLKGKEGKKSKKSEDDEEDESGEEEEEDSDEDSQLIGEYESFLENGGDEDDDDGDEEDDESGEEEEEDSDESEAEEEQPKAKVAKLSPGASAKKAGKEQNGVAKKEETKQQQKKKEKPEAKKEKEQPKPKEQAKQQPAAGGERSLSGGVKVVDVLAGKGEEAKPGKRVSVYYTGRLQSNNKTFDSLLKGKPFKFSLGGGEVIKGWDVGVAGMKVGGKRRITCPPHMGYGSRGAPPKIGPNSTLVFDVELKAVH